MTTPTGQIAASDINVELGRASNASFNLNDPVVRALAAAGGSGTRNEMNWLRGKSSYTPMTLTGHDDYATGTTYGGTATTVSCYPSVTVAGGAGPFTYSWIFVTGSFSMSGADTYRPRVYTSVKYSLYADAELQVTVTDSKGNSVTIRGIWVTFEVYQDGQEPM